MIVVDELVQAGEWTQSRLKVARNSRILAGWEENMGNRNERMELTTTISKMGLRLGGTGEQCSSMQVDGGGNLSVYELVMKWQQEAT